MILGDHGAVLQGHPTKLKTVLLSVSSARLLVENYYVSPAGILNFEEKNDSLSLEASEYLKSYFKELEKANEKF